MEAKDRIKFRIGFSRMEKKYEWKDHLIFMGLLFGLAVWVNRGIEIKGLYMDDLYFWLHATESRAFCSMYFLRGVPVSAFFIIWQRGWKWLWLEIMYHGSYPLTSF